MARKDKKNSRAARRGEIEEIDLKLPEGKVADGKTRALEELALKQTRMHDEEDQSLKPKSQTRTKSKAQSRRNRQKAIKAEAFSDMLAEKVKASAQRQKLVKTYRKEDEE